MDKLEMTFEQLRTYINSKPKEEEFIINFDFTSLDLEEKNPVKEPTRNEQRK